MFVRSLVFNVFLALWSAAVLLGMGVLMPLHRRHMLAVVRRWTRISQGALSAIVGLRYEFRGIENIPAGPAIYACKHQSAWDTMGFFLRFDDPAHVIKKELIDLPFYGWFARKCRVIGVDRKGGAQALRNLVRQAMEAIGEGREIIIFPQGTRTAPGERRPYQPGIAALYGRADVPVIPVALNSGLFWGRRSFVKRPGTIVVEFLPAVPAGLDRRAFMKTLENRIEEASERLAAPGDVEDKT